MTQSLQFTLFLFSSVAVFWPFTWKNIEKLVYVYCDRGRAYVCVFIWDESTPKWCLRFCLELNRSSQPSNFVAFHFDFSSRLVTTVSTQCLSMCVYMTFPVIGDAVVVFDFCSNLLKQSSSFLFTSDVNNLKIYKNSCSLTFNVPKSLIEEANNKFISIYEQR